MAEFEKFNSVDDLRLNGLERFRERRKNRKLLRKIIDFFKESWDYLYNDLYGGVKWYLYHRIKQSHLIHSELKSGTWYEIDVMMEESIFSLLSEYVSRDGQDAFSVVVIEGDERSEIIEILHFYHVRRHELEKEHDELLHKAVPTGKPSVRKYLHAHRKLEEYIHEETSRQLKRVIELRNRLWT